MSSRQEASPLASEARGSILPTRAVKADADGDRIADARGDTVSVRGVVTASLIAIPGEFRAYIQDPTAGIRLVSETAETFAALSVGDTVTVTGVVDFYAGTDFLRVIRLWREASGPPPEPRSVTVADVLREDLEGMLVALEGRLINAQRVELRDRSGRSVRIRARRALLEDQGFQKRFYSQNPASVVGIVEQYDPSAPHDSGYRIELRSRRDLVVHRDFRIAAAVSVVVLLIVILWQRSRREARRARRMEELLERVRASEAAVREREQRLAAVAQATTDVIWDLDLEDLTVRLGGGASELLGCSADEVPRDLDGLMSWVHEDDRERILQRAEERLASGKDQWESEFRLVRADGEIVFVVDRVRVLRAEDGTPHRVVGALVDVTKERADEEARRLLRRKMEIARRLESLGALAGGIAHDFNNILTTILVNAELLESSLPDDFPDKELVRSIREGAVRAAALTHQLLALAGRAIARPELVDLNSLVRESERAVREILAPEAVVEYALEPNLPPVTGDPRQLGEMVTNLLTNAAEALEGGPGTIRLKTEYRTLGEQEVLRLKNPRPLRDEPYVVLSISDTGRGMDERQQDRMFEPFFTTKPDRRGLGLSAVLGIVHGHGGHLTIESEVGRGTSVTVFLPPAEDQPQRSAPTPEPRQPAEEPLPAAS